MFIPEPFKIKDEKIIYDLLRDYSFATLVSSKQNQLQATNLPLLLSKDKKSLIGHMAIANEQWKTLSGNSVLAIFHGPHHYISPSWYETKDAVPTWNYISLQVSGNFVPLDDEHQLVESLKHFVDTYETMESEYLLEHVDPNYLANLRKGIIGFKIEIHNIEAKAKLSQNHSTPRQSLVIEELKKIKSENALAIANWMQENLKNLKQ